MHEPVANTGRDPDPAEQHVVVIEGTHAASYAAKLARVQVVAAYPITPQTGVVEELSEMCASGELNARFIKVESEHSAMACCIGASATGARAFTATSSQGLALMHELLHWAAGGRLPIVMVNVNRAMAPPWSIYADHNDSLSQRDTGWMQFYAESNQEVLDSIFQAYYVAEKVHLPCMINLDAFFLSHTTEPVSIPPQELVDRYLLPYQAVYRLDPHDPHSFGGLASADTYMEFRFKIQEAMEKARVLIQKQDELFLEMFGRTHGGLVEEYRCEDADEIIILAGTAVSTARIVVDEFRERGARIGLLKLRTFRPFPEEEIRSIAYRTNKIAVLDRDFSFGAGGIFAQEIRSVLFGENYAPGVFSYIAGLGGRDITPVVIRDIVYDMHGRSKPSKEPLWIGLKP
ncbi:MAG: pyruvate ferredoxin oxidoreductase [Bacteroidota bacterium]